MVTRNRASRAMVSVLRAAVPSVVAFVGLTAVIVGILAMHVWMGGHGSTSHHASPSTATAVSPGPEAGLASSDPADAHGGGKTGHVHAGTTTTVMAAVAAARATAVDAASTTAPEAGVLAGCAGDCADEMMLGMCVVAMIVGLAGLLTPAGRAFLFTLGRRGPPALSWASRLAPAPSLTQLCISRT